MSEDAPARRISWVAAGRRASLAHKFNESGKDAADRRQVLIETAVRPKAVVVAVRLRPLNARELASEMKDSWAYSTNMCDSTSHGCSVRTTYTPSSLRVKLDDGGAPKVFEYDKVFPPGVPNIDVYAGRTACGRSFPT